MSDDKFTKTAASLLTGMRDLVDWGIGGGHTTPDQLRLAVIPRKAIPDLKKQGLSNREIAKLTGVTAIHPLNKALHPIPPQIAQESYRKNHIDPRFHTWGNRRGRFPPEMHATKFGVVAYSQENDRGSIRCIGRLAPEDRCLCPECFGPRFDRSRCPI